MREGIAWTWSTNVTSDRSKRLSPHFARTSWASVACTPSTYRARLRPPKLWRASRRLPRSSWVGTCRLCFQTRSLRRRFMRLVSPLPSAALPICSRARAMLPCYLRWLALGHVQSQEPERNISTNPGPRRRSLEWLPSRCRRGTSSSAIVAATSAFTSSRCGRSRQLGVAHIDATSVRRPC